MRAILRLVLFLLRTVVLVAALAPTNPSAETTASEATDAGKRAGFPLLFTTEPEE